MGSRILTAGVTWSLMRSQMVRFDVPFSQRHGRAGGLAGSPHRHLPSDDFGWLECCCM